MLGIPHFPGKRRGIAEANILVNWHFNHSGSDLDAASVSGSGSGSGSELGFGLVLVLVLGPRNLIPYRHIYLCAD